MGPADESAPITGRCPCGRVRFEVSEPLLEAEYCHCRRCQRRSGGTGTVSALCAPGAFWVTEGDEALGSYLPDDGRWRDYFCRECGGHVFAEKDEDDADPRPVCLPMGAIDGDPGVRPSFHQYVAYAPAWDRLPDDGLPRFDESPPPPSADS